MSEDAHVGLLAALEDALPIKRQVNISGWPRPVWVWRLELYQLVELNQRRKLLNEDTKGVQEWGLELLAMCLGDEGAPGTFANAKGRSWLRRQPEAVALLIPIAIEFNELTGPSDARKKKLATPAAPAPCLTSAALSESLTPDDSHSI